MLTALLSLVERCIPSHPIPCAPERVRKILVVDLNFLGDMLMSSPVVRALKEHFPESRIDVLGYAIVGPALQANPYIDVLHLVKRPRTRIPLGVVPALRRERYDLVLQLNTSLLVNLLMLLIGGRYRLGYNYAHRGCLNTIRVPIRARTARAGNRVDECIALVEQAFGWTVVDRRMVLRIPDEARDRVARVLQEEHLADAPLLIAMHTNCRQDQEQRRWKGDQFAALARRLIAETKCTVLFTGGREDHAYVESIVRTVADPVHARNLAGTLSLIETAALLKRAHLFVTINTGPMHLALAVDVPTVAIVGGTPAAVVCPSGNPLFRFLEDPALRLWDPHAPWQGVAPAINSITVAAVFDEVVKLLGITGRPDAPVHAPASPGGR